MLRGKQRRTSSSFCTSLGTAGCVGRLLELWVRVVCMSQRKRKEEGPRSFQDVMCEIDGVGLEYNPESLLGEALQSLKFDYNSLRNTSRTSEAISSCQKVLSPCTWFWSVLLSSSRADPGPPSFCVTRPLSGRVSRHRPC